MAIEENEVKQFEEDYKTQLFQVTKEIASNVSDLLEKIKKLEKYVALNIDLPNIGVTLNNKMIELQREFEKAGISMYSRKVEDKATLKQSVITTSLVGDSVISQLIEGINKAIDDLQNYYKIIALASNRKIEEAKALKEMTRLDKFLAKIKDIFFTQKKDTSLCTQEEKKMLHFYLSKYKEKDNEIWNYNLRDNILQNLTRKITKKGYDYNVITRILEERVMPDLEKLGLSDLIPELKEILIKEDKKQNQVPNEIKKNKEILENTPKGTEDNSLIDDDYSL